MIAYFNTNNVLRFFKQQLIEEEKSIVFTYQGSVCQQKTDLPDCSIQAHTE